MEKFRRELLRWYEEHNHTVTTLAILIMRSSSWTHDRLNEARQIRAEESGDDIYDFEEDHVV